jgi:hypothetical protein
VFQKDSDQLFSVSLFYSIVACFFANIYLIFVGAVTHLQANFEQSILEGRVETLMHSAVINKSGNIEPPGSWATERFGHMACYFGNNL